MPHFLKKKKQEHPSLEKINLATLLPQHTRAPRLAPT